MDDGGREEETSNSDSSFGNMADGNRDSPHNASNNVVDLTLGSGGTSSVCPTDDSNEDWCRFGGIRLIQQNKYGILRGNKLNNLVINFVQKLLKKQFPSVKGLQSTLLQSKPPKPLDDNCALHLQVIHCRNDHWIVASSVHSPGAKVQIYDSLFDTIDSHTKDTVFNLFGSSAIPELVTVPKQTGNKNCGVFALANLTALLRNEPCCYSL